MLQPTSRELCLLLGVAVNRSRKARSARKRKRRMDRVEHDLSDEEWTALKVAWGGCAYCCATDRPLVTCANTVKSGSSPALLLRLMKN